MLLIVAMRRHLTVLVVFLLVISAFCVDTENRRIRRFRTTLHACMREFRTLCYRTAERPQQEAGVVTPRSRNFPFQCLSKNIDMIEGLTCKTWVESESACRAAIVGPGKCKDNVETRVCLSRISESDLPANCTDSVFYKEMSAASRVPRGVWGPANPEKRNLGNQFGA